MRRRDFIFKTAVSGLALATWTASCSKTSTPSEDAEPGDDFPFNEFTIDELQQKMVASEFTARSIAEAYLKRIDAIDRTGASLSTIAGPSLNSIIELNPDALAIADALDEERKQGKVRGPLHGIPVLLKDNIDTGDKMSTTAGSLALEGHKAKKDAFIVARLRDAGAVILGKTNLSEWANFRSRRSSSGWSSRGGQTHNPYAIDRNPCGSSSGSGVAVSANLCAVAIGTETDGSVACPSSVNGVVGIKPTVGLWSRSGIIPISKSQDTAGPMARTVRDAAILLGPLTGTDTHDEATAKAAGKALQDYTSFLDANGLQGARIGIEKSYLKVHESVDALLQKALDQMKAKGATLVEVELMKELKSLTDEEFQVLMYEFKDGLNKYLADADGPIKSLHDVIEFNKKNESRAMPFFKQEILEESDTLGGLDTPKYKTSLERLQKTVRTAIDKILSDNKLDAICGPANGPTWCTDPVNGDFFTGYGMYSPAAQAGYPSITIPMGLVFGLPIGISFIGAPYSEGKLLKIGYAYEQASRMRTPPTFVTSAQLTQ